MEAMTTTWGAGPVLRPAHSDDRFRLERLLERCSDDTLFRRFHGAVGSAVRAELQRIAQPTPLHRSWVTVAGGEIRGTATLAWGSDGVAEIAILVEDGWRRRGVGRDLLGALFAQARRAGLDEILARIQGDNEAARRFLHAVAPRAHAVFVGGGELEIAVPLDHLPVPPDASPFSVALVRWLPAPATHLGRIA